WPLVLGRLAGRFSGPGGVKRDWVAGLDQRLVGEPIVGLALRGLLRRDDLAVLRDLPAGAGVIPAEFGRHQRRGGPGRGQSPAASRPRASRRAANPAAPSSGTSWVRDGGTAPGPPGWPPSGRAGPPPSCRAGPPPSCRAGPPPSCRAGPPPSCRAGPPPPGAA